MMKKTILALAAAALVSAARAEAGYRNALRYGYPDSTLLLWLAQVQLEQGKYREAEENFSLYLQSVPDNPLTPLAQAGLLSAQTADSRKQESRGNLRARRFGNVRAAA